MDKCCLCRGQRKKAKLLSFGFLCHSCLATARQVMQEFGLVGYAMAIAVVNQVRLRENCLEKYEQRFIGSPLYWNQKRKKK